MTGCFTAEKAPRWAAATWNHWALMTLPVAAKLSEPVSSSISDPIKFAALVQNKEPTS